MVEGKLFASGVYLLCLFSPEKLSDPIDIDASSFQAHCLVKCGPSALETVLRIRLWHCRHQSMPSVCAVTLSLIPEIEAGTSATAVGASSVISLPTFSSSASSFLTSKASSDAGKSSDDAAQSSPASSQMANAMPSVSLTSKFESSQVTTLNASSSTSLAGGSDASATLTSASSAAAVTSTGEALACYEQSANATAKQPLAGTIYNGIMIVITTSRPPCFGLYDKSAFESNKAAASVNDANWSSRTTVTEGITLTQTVIAFQDATLTLTPPIRLSTGILSTQGPDKDASKTESDTETSEKVESTKGDSWPEPANKESGPSSKEDAAESSTSSNEADVSKSNAK